MRTQIVAEGGIRLEVPELDGFRTSTGDFAPSLTPVFYNPQMEACRDISVGVLHVLAGELGELRVCDPLGGAGVRGLRYAKEVKEAREVVINDLSKEAFKMIERNVALNSLTNVLVRNEDANVLLRSDRRRFHVVDLDPFGSPAPFLESACSSLLRGGILAVTATDTAPLSGTYPKACLRKYGARSIRTEYGHELGIRILIGFCQRVGGIHELALLPILSHATRHYFRIYLKVTKGSRRVDEVLAKHGYVMDCSCGRRVITRGMRDPTCKCGKEFRVAGPLWLGDLGDAKFIRRIIDFLKGSQFRLKHVEIRMLELCAEEAHAPPTFYDSHKLARRMKTSPPKMERILKELAERGHFVSRTHFSPVGFKTDASFEELSSILSGGG